MRSGLDHLPASKRRELERLANHLLTEFETALAGAQQNWKKQGRILKVILFGSFARGDWKEDRKGGYLSDFDILVIVNNKKLTDTAEYWYVAEDKIQRDSGIRRPVNVIVHSLKEVNDALIQGQYFFADIVQDGVMLYDLPGHNLATPVPLTATDALAVATRYFDKKAAAVTRFLKLAKVSMAEGISDPEWRNNAAFNLHQATETAYHCAMFVRTFYHPKSHNLTFLRSLAEDIDNRLISVWQRDTRQERRRFELLKDAYVNARYSEHYQINLDDLTALTASVASLHAAVEASCIERLEELRAEADGAIDATLQ